MIPRPFEYFAPSSLSEVISLLNQYKDEAKILAGGQSLIPLMKFRFASPKYLIDINKVPKLSGIEISQDGQLSIGSMTSHHDVEKSKIVREVCPVLSETAGNIGDTQVRHRGTIGGSICHADPVADYPPLMLILDATFTATDEKSERAIKAADFFVDIFTTALKPTEVMTRVEIPPPAKRTGSSYLKICRRSGDFAMVGAAAKVRLDEKGKCDEVKVSLSGLGPVPVRAKAVEEALIDQKLTVSTISGASAKATENIHPSTDTHATAEYRMEVTPVLTRRAIVAAWKRAVRGRER